MTIPEQHMLKIARQTLRYSDVGARIMGGMTKDEARAVIYRLTGRHVPSEAELDKEAARRNAP